MARKWGWFSAVKKAISIGDSQKDQNQKNHKLNTTWSAEPADVQPALSSKEEPTFDVAPPLPSIGTDQKEISEEINEKIKHAYSVDDATAAVAADAQDAATADAHQAAEEVVHLTSPPHYLLGKTKEEIAAIKIQTAFRGYLARRTLHALRGLKRLKTLTQEHSVKQQAEASLRCMKTLAKVQSQIRERRIRMSEENLSLQRQQQRKHEKEPNKPQTTVGENWDDSTKSKEEIEARLLDRKEAAMRREKARAYSSMHQQTWKKQQQPSKRGDRTLTDINSMNPDWSWSWGERWRGSRPWDEKRGGSVADCGHAQKPSRPPAQHSAAVSGGKARPQQLHRRHSSAGLSVREDDDDVGSSSGKAKYSAAPSKLFALSPNRTSPSASKRHSCPPQILLNPQMPCSPSLHNQSQL